VELQTQQQRLIAVQNQVQIDKLTLARIIGLPAGQEFRLTDSVPYAALDSVTQDQALQQAYSTRPDFLSAKAQLRAAELAHQATSAENYPSLSTNTNYGDIGSPNFGTSHGTLGFAVTLNIPIYQGTRVRADKLQADAALQQRKAEVAALEGEIDRQVRTAFFNLKSSSDLVKVAESNTDLAGQTLAQARDRFRAGLPIISKWCRRRNPWRRPISPTSTAFTLSTWQKSHWRRPSAWPSNLRCSIWNEITMTDTTPNPQSDHPNLEARPVTASVGGGRSSRRRGPGRKILLVVVLVALVVGGVLLYHHLSQWESTDDAESTGISTRSAHASPATLPA